MVDNGELGAQPLDYVGLYQRLSIWQKRSVVVPKAIETVVFYGGFIESHTYAVWKHGTVIQSGGFAHGLSLAGKLMLSFNLREEGFSFVHYQYRHVASGTLSMIEPVSGVDY